MVDVDTTFRIGPPDPITDSRDLPAITPLQEADFVTGADLGSDHPDNVPLDPAAVDDVPPEVEPADDVLPTEGELDTVVSTIDPNEADAVGFDETDLVEPLGPPVTINLGDQAPVGGW